MNKHALIVVYKKIDYALVQHPTFSNTLKYLMIFYFPTVG